MRISTKVKPELCVAKAGEDALCHVRLVLPHGKQGYLLASDGTLAVKLPCDVDAGDKEGVITVEAIAAARRHAKKDDDGGDGKMTVIRGAVIDVPDAKQTHEPPELQKDLFPAEAIRIPGRGRKGQQKLSLDAMQLAKLAKAMATRRVTLYYVPGKDEIRVEPEDEAPVWGAEAVMLANSSSEPVEEDGDDEGGDAA